jgi:hypothetical protein
MVRVAARPEPKRGMSQLPTGRNAYWHITEFDQFGEPVRPHIALSKYKTVLGHL